jgi:protein subunit release factor B
MAQFGVSEEKEAALWERWADLGISQEDVRESFVRSGGNGGQNVNKVATCVQLKHLPTGIEVKCQKERSQAMNRYHARKILADKIDKIQHGAMSAEQQRIEKIRRQKRRRSRRATAKMLDDKRHQGEKKQNRKPPGSDG